MWFRKIRLTMQRVSKDDCGEIISPSPWCKIVARQETLIACYSDLALGLYWYRNVVACLLNTDSVRGKFLTEYMQRWETGTCVFWEEYLPSR